MEGESWGEAKAAVVITAGLFSGLALAPSATCSCYTLTEGNESLLHLGRNSWTMRTLAIAFPTLYVERWSGTASGFVAMLSSPRRRTSSDVAMPPRGNSQSNTGRVGDSMTMAPSGSMV